VEERDERLQQVFGRDPSVRDFASYVPDLLVEDDCESIGGAAQTCAAS
jgi:hypothetical protein